MLLDEFLGLKSRRLTVSGFFYGGHWEAVRECPFVISNGA